VATALPCGDRRRETNQIAEWRSLKPSKKW